MNTCVIVCVCVCVCVFVLRRFDECNIGMGIWGDFFIKIEMDYYYYFYYWAREEDREQLLCQGDHFLDHNIVLIFLLCMFYLMSNACFDWKWHVQLNYDSDHFGGNICEIVQYSFDNPTVLGTPLLVCLWRESSPTPFLKS